MIKRIIHKFQNLIERSRHPVYDPSLEYEFCPRCEANLTLQRGYCNALPYWKCLGCGQMLINPTAEEETGILWFCDGCGALLNMQSGFRESGAKLSGQSGANESQTMWRCTECGFENAISAEEIYASDDEYQAELRNPYRGLSGEDLLELSLYEEIGTLGNHENVTLVRHRETGVPYVKKELVTYDVSIYQYLMEHPVRHVPRILRLFEGKESLIVIEEYVQGETLEELLAAGPLETERAVRIARKICMILDELHHLEKPMVHRDVKPSNVIVTPEGEVWLLDVNVAKWHDPEQVDDTRHVGTWNYAAPEQAGYGMKASSPKTDVYAVGMLLNVMLTGAFPKEKQAEGELWDVIERCICLNAEERYSDDELMDALSEFQKTI